MLKQTNGFKTKRSGTREIRYIEPEVRLRCVSIAITLCRQRGAKAHNLSLGHDDVSRGTRARMKMLTR